MSSDRAGDYITGLFGAEDELLASLREEADRTGLPPIAISSAFRRRPPASSTADVHQRAPRTRRRDAGRLLGELHGARCRRAARWCRSRLDDKHVTFARRYIDRAGLSDRIDVRVGRALDVLPSLDGTRYDAMFLDADKEPLPTYFEWAIRLVRPGGLIIGDNALWGGRVYEGDETDDRTRGVREFNRRMATDPRVLGIIDRRRMMELPLQS